MNRVLITDTATVTSLGTDLNSLWAGLLDKKTGIKQTDRFKTDNFISPYAALIDNLSGSGKRSMIFRLADRLIEQLSDIPEDTLLFVASTKSGIDILEKKHDGVKIAGQGLIMASLTGYISQKLKLTDRGININSACASSTIAVAKAGALIASGREQSVLVCCLDIVSQFVFSGFSAIRAMSSEPAMPFDIQRKGLTLGEGGAAILLQSEEAMKKNKKTEIASLAGWGVANDATHLTAPARDGSGLKIAVSNALTIAAIPPDAVGAVSTHGTGTVYNDLMEIKVIRALFHNRNLPANSVKGSIGHTLGAAGGIEIALASMMLDKGIVPGTTGLIQPEQEAEGILSPDHQSFSGDYLLSTNSGFGGTNGAVIIKRRAL